MKERLGSNILLLFGISITLRRMRSFVSLDVTNIIFVY